MTFLEFVQAEETAESRFDTIMSKCNAFLEASYNRYNINLKEARLKVLTENGNYDDLVYLENEASEGLLARTKKTVEKIIENLKEFFKNIIDAITGFFDDIKVKNTLKKAEKLSKDNPEIRKMTVEVPDIEAIDKVDSEHCDKTKRRLVRAKTSSISGKDIDDMTADEADYNKKISKAKKATIVISISAVVSLIGVYLAKVKSANTKEYDNVANNVTIEGMDEKLELLKASVNASRARMTNLSTTLKNMMKQLSAKIHGKDLRAAASIVSSDMLAESSKCDDDSCGKDITQCPNEAKKALNNSNDKPNNETLVKGIIDKVKAEKIAAAKESVDNDDNESDSLTAEEELDIIESLIDLSDDTDDTEEVEESSAEDILASIEKEMEESAAAELDALIAMLD